MELPVLRPPPPKIRPFWGPPVAKPPKWLENRPLLKGFEPEKWGEVVRASVKTPRASVKMLRAAVKTPRATVKAFRATVNALRATVNAFGAMVKAFRATVNGLRATVNTFGATVKAFGEVVKALGATGNALGDWGGCPGQWGAAVSRRVWGAKIRGSGRVTTARRLARRLPTHSRFRRECGRRSE